MADETHLDMLQQIAGRPALFLASDPVPGGPDIRVAYWMDFPEPGMITAFTVGLSALDGWEDDIAPELILSVESTELRWASALGELAARGVSEGFGFAVDQTLDYGGPIVESSEISGFLLAPQMMMPSEFTLLETAAGPVALRQMVPLYPIELTTIARMGSALFIASRPDPNSVIRPKVFSDQIL